MAVKNCTKIAKFKHLIGNFCKNKIKNPCQLKFNWENIFDWLLLYSA